MPKTTILSEVLFGLLILGLATAEGIVIALQFPVAAIALPVHPTDLLTSQAQALNNEGTRQLARGNAEAALEIWKRAEAAYAKVGDEIGILGSQLNQAQALQTLGQYRLARAFLEQINTRSRALPDSPLKASSLQSLGIVLFRVGDLQESRRILQSSLEISQRLNTDTSSTLLALGNVARAHKNDSKAEKMANGEAIAFYQQAIVAASDKITQLQAQLNLFSLFVETDQSLQATPLLSEIQALLADLPPSRTTIYAQVNLAESLMKLEGISRSQIHSR